MRWIYLSPHFDDVVLSCGGLVWEQVQSGQLVEVWTICAGSPGNEAVLSNFVQEVHQRWGTGPEAVSVRRNEDEQAVRLLGANTRYWDLPDCIYRRLPGGEWLINNNEDLWQPLHPAEQGTVDRLADWISRGLDEIAAGVEIQLVSPLTLGNHVDHRVVRAAYEQVMVGRKGSSLYYADYPYAVQAETDWTGKMGEGWRKTCQPVSREALEVWQNAVARYTSQLSTFWSSQEEMRAGMETYWQSGGGTCLWRPGGA